MRARCLSESGLLHFTQPIRELRLQLLSLHNRSAAPHLTLQEVLSRRQEIYPWARVNRHRGAA